MKKRKILIAVILSAAFHAQAQKLSPNTSLMLNDWEAQKKEAVQKNGMNAPADRMVSAFISVDDSKVADELRKHGVTVRSVLGGVVTASLPISYINTIAAIDGVTNIQAGTEWWASWTTVLSMHMPTSSRTTIRKRAWHAYGTSQPQVAPHPKNTDMALNIPH